MDYRNNHNANSQRYQTLLALPKIDLHRHLEGSLRLNTMAEIAQQYQLDLPGYGIEDFRHMVQVTQEDKADAVAFLSKFKALRHFYRSPEVIDRITYEAVADAAAEKIVYLELRFTPIALAREGRFALEDVADWVIGAVTRAQKDFDIMVRLLVSMNRHESVELGEKCLDIAIEHMSEGVVGVDLAGAENKFPGAPFAPIFSRARAAGLSVTIHAGEWAGPESVREATDRLGAMRLGHGVRVVQDAELIKTARDRQIAFEVCMTSNFQSGVSPSLDQHPLRELYQHGLLTTINTDDPSVSAINLTDELVIAMDHLDFSLDDIKQNVLNAAQAAFLIPQERDQLISRLMADFYPNGMPAALQARALQSRP